ncbi:hypothetical protein FRB91_007618 [Serendipita sp. 411]|nr:hypothetical protein FRB91_007618 [Serendipita sp. 411]
MSVALICLFLIPDAKRYKSQTAKFNILGVSLLTMADILFILTVTSDSTQGWATAYVLTPLIISFVLTALFFVWKARITLEDAVLPPMMWAILQLWILSVYGSSAINIDIYFLTLGIGAWLVSNLTGLLPFDFSHLIILIFGLLLAIIVANLTPLRRRSKRVSASGFPAFALGTIGMMFISVNSAVVIFAYTSSSVVGTVGTVFNCALQLGTRPMANRTDLTELPCTCKDTENVGCFDENRYYHRAIVASTRK